ncbi:hypothetical protein ABPG74_000633 [Tetrahymena malaccensis]
MKLLQTLLWLGLILKLIQCAIKPFGSIPLKAYSSNQKEITYFLFSFLNEISINSNAFVQVIFPHEYKAFFFETTLECQMLENVKSILPTQLQNGSFRQLPCEFNSDGVILIEAGYIISGINQVVVGQIRNPSLPQTSEFGIRTYYNDVMVEQNDAFSTLSLAPPPLQMQNPEVYRVSNSRINEGSTWQFDFQTIQSYNFGNTFRFTFPDGFQSQKVLCNVDDLYGQDPIVEIYHNKRIISCKNLQKKIDSGSLNSVKLINMVNPYYSGFMQGFAVEVLQGNSTIVLEKAYFPGNIEIYPGLLNITYQGNDNFKLSNTTYAFFINLVNPVDSSGKLYINFTKDWYLFSPNCTVISGFKLKTIFTSPDPQIRCMLLPQQNSYLIENFQSIDSSSRLVVTIFLQSPPLQNQYPVTIGTYNTVKNAFIDLGIVNININATYGSTRVFAAHPMQIPIRLSACQSGPLEITLFLKNPLPQTNVGTVGKIIIEIFPQLPSPPVQNGIFTCYFFATIPSSKCTYDTSKTDRTIITVYTPLDQGFHESEIPITITTVGPLPGYDAGIQLPKLVQSIFILTFQYLFQIRYLFFITFWDCECQLPQNTPKEVYFTEFVPYAFNIPSNSISATNLVTNQNEFTYLTFQYTHPSYNGVCTAPSGFDLYETQRNYIYKIDFVNYNQLAWKSYAGYSQKQIIQNYPCYVYGTQIDSTDKITCDLHCDQTQSYLTVQGFKTSKVTVGSTINIEIPRIGIVDQAGVQVYYSFSLNEETPGMLGQYVQIYKYQGFLFTTTQYPTQNSYPTIPQITLSSNVVNQASSHQYSFTISSSAQFIIYELQQVPSIFPNLAFKVFTCGPNTSQCITYPSPVNWIVFTPNAAQTNTAQTIINSGDIFHNPPYAGDFIYKARIISSNIVTQTNTLIFHVVPGNFNPATISLDSSEDPNQIFKLLEHKFVIQITTQNPVQQDGGLIVTVYNCQLSQSQYFYLEVNGINKLNVDGVLYKKISTTQLQIYNLDAFVANTQVKIILYLLMPSTSTANIQVDVTSYWNRNFQNKVDQILGLQISAPLTLRDIAMQDFQVVQPVEINQTPGVNYVGPFFTNFIPQNPNPLYIRCTWQVDFTTPGVPGQDPLICQVAGKVVPCYYQNSNPLCIILDTSGISISNASASQISVSTQYVAPQNGLKFPSQGGWYEYDVEVLNAAKNPIEKYSQFIFITPKLMNYLKTESAISQSGAYNIISFYFSNTDPIPQYSNGGLIQLQFPTVSADGSTNIFDSSLGIASGVTGTPVGCWFSASIPGSNLSCSLIKSQTTGRPAFIEIHNFDLIPANTDMIIRVGGIRNPTNQVSLVTLTVTILQRNIATGTYYYINQMQDNLALNIPSSVSTPPTELMQINVAFPGSNPQFSHPLQSNFNLNVGDYFVTVLPQPFLSISTNKGVLPSCDLATYQYCIAFSQINWIVLKLKVQLASNTIKNTLEDILQLPQYVPNTQITFPTQIWNNNQYNSYLTNVISPSIFDGVVTPITISAVKCAGNPNKCLQNKQRVEVLISFTNPKPIPLNGAILIIFPPEIPNIYAQCRSSTANGSQLYSVAGNYAGEIGCEVQSTRNWVINGFQQTPAGSNIAIYGYIDMPASGGQTQNVQIFVYYNYDNTNQFNNGFKIMRTTTAGQFNVISQNPLGLSENTSIFKIDSPVKQGYIGPFVIQLNFNSPSGIFNLYFALQDYVNNPDSVGFGITTSVNRYKCAFYIQQPKPETLSNYMNCNIKSISLTANFVIVQIEPLNPSQLSSGTTYTFELTSQKGDGSVEGIEWPTKNGVYQIVIENTSINLKQSIYADIIQDNFTNADVQGYVTLQGEPNIIDVSLTPSVQIISSNLLVLEIGAVSSDGSTQLFSANPGSLSDYSQVVIDIIPTIANPLNFECRFSKGNPDVTLNGGVSIKVLCSKFSRIVAAGENLRFVFQLQNPAFTATPQQTVVPLNIYTQDVQANRKLNYILIENSSLFVTSYNPSSNILSSSAPFTPSSSSLAVTNSNLQFQSGNSQPIGPRDTYILRFQFAFVGTTSINLNTLQQNGQNVGQVILLQNLQTLLLTPSNGFTLTSANVASIIGCWNTPQYLLATQVTGYAYYRQQRRTEKIVYTSFYGDGSGTPTPSSAISLTMSLVNGVALAGQKEDYIISITAPQFKSTKKLMIKYPTGVFGINSFDCRMSPGSQIEISRCYMNQIGSDIAIWVDITNNSQHLNTPQKLIIQTTNLAMVNPSNAKIVVNMNTFFVKFFSWNGSVEPVGLDTSVTLNNYVIQAGTDSSGTTFSFNSNAIQDHPVLDFKHFRYIDDFYLTDGTLTRALIQFEFKIPTALSATPNNVLNIVYPQQIVVDPQITQTSDTLRNTLRCMINNNYRKCTINQSTRTISIQFTYGLSANQIIFVSVGVIDPFKYPQKYGFGWNTDYTYGQFLINISDGTNNIFLNSDVQNMKAVGTGILPQNGFTSMAINYVQTSVINSDCLIELLFTWSVSGITTLVIEVPTTNEDQTPIYDTDIFPGMMSGQNVPCVINPVAGGTNNLQESANQILDCVIERGEIGNFGRPMRIYVRGFSYTLGLSNNLLFKIVTPSVVGRIVNFKIKAIGGNNSVNQVGDQLIAWSDIYKVLITVAGVNPTTTNQPISFDTTPYGFPYGSNASTIRSTTTITFINEPMQIQIPFYVNGNYCIIPLVRDPTDISAYYDNVADQVTLYSLKPWIFLVYAKFSYNVILLNPQQIIHSQYTSSKTQKQITNFSFDKTQYSGLVVSTLISSIKSNVFDTFKNALKNQGIYSFDPSSIMNSSIYSELFTDGNGIFQISFNGLIIQTSQYITKCFVMKGLRNLGNPYLMPTCQAIGTSNTITIINFDTIDAPLQIVYQYDQNIGTYTSSPASQFINLYINSASQIQDLPSYYQSDLRIQPTLITSSQLQFQNFVLASDLSSIQVQVQSVACCQFYSVGSIILLQFQINTDDEQLIGANINVASTFSITFGGVAPNSNCMIQTQGNEQARVLQCQFTVTSAMTIDSNWVPINIQFTGGTPLVQRDFYWFRINICDSFQNIKYTVSLEYSRNDPISSQPISVTSISQAAGSPTLLIFTIKSINIPLNPVTNQKLFLEFQSNDWPNQLIQGIDVSVSHSAISCLCYEDISTQPIFTSKCYFHRQSLPTSKDFLPYHLIEIPITVPIGKDVKCLIPMVLLPPTSSTNLKLAFISTIESIRPFFSSRLLTQSQARYYQNAAAALVSKTGFTISQTYTVNFPLNIYDGSVFISSTVNNYQIKITGSTAIDVPSIIIAFDPAAGPIFNKQMCLNFQDCQNIGTSILYYRIQANGVTDFSTQSAAISLINYAQKLFTDYQIQIYIYSSDGHWSLDPSTYSIPQSKNGLKPPAAQAITASLMPYSINTCGYYATYVFTTVVELEDMNLNYAFQLVLSQSQIPQVTQACSAKSLSNKALLFCRFTQDAVNYYYTVKILRTNVNIVSKSMIIAITLELKNPSPATPTQATATANYEIRYYRQFISQTNYQMISSNSNTLTFDNTYQAAGFTQYSRTYLKFYRFSPIVPCDGTTITTCPIRFFYQNNLPATNYNTLQIQVTTGTTPSSIKVPVTCLAKINNPNGSYTRNPLNCNFISLSGTVQITNPASNSIIASGQTYEIIMTLGYLNLPVNDFSNISYLASVTTKISNQNVLITQRYITQYLGTSSATFQKFFILSAQESQVTSIYFEATLNNAQTTTNLFPASYIEVLLPQIDYTSPITQFKIGMRNLLFIFLFFFSKFYFQYIGQQIPCDITSNLASIPNYQTPVCTVNLKSSSGPVFVRLEKINSYSAGALLTLAIDDVKLVTLTDLQTFDMTLNIQNGNSFYTNTAINLIPLQIQPPYNPPNVDPTTYQFNAASLQLGATTSYSGSITWPLNTLQSQFGDKYRISFGTQGIVGVGNSVSALTFSDNLIWMNKQTQRVILKSPDRLLGATFSLQFNNIFNPVIANLIYYGANPTFTSEFYSVYLLTNQVNSYYPQFQTFINPTQPIQFISLTNVPGYYPLNRDELFSLTFQLPKVLPFQEVLIQLKDPTVLKFKSCLLVRSNGNQLSQCNVISSSTLGLFGISYTSISPATHQMYFIAEVDSTNPIVVNLLVTNDGITTYNLFLNIQITSPPGQNPSLTSMQALNLNKVKYFSTLNTLTITQPSIYAGTNVKQLFFEFLAIKSLTYNSNPSQNELVQITLPDNSGNFQPVVANDANNLVCYFLQKQQNTLQLPVYSNMFLASSCILDKTQALPAYKIGSPTVGLIQGNTYQVIIYIDGGQNSLFQIPASFSRDELLFQMTGQTTTVSDTIILFTTIKNFNQLSINYGSMQQGETDNLLILSINLLNSLQAIDSTHDVFVRLELDSQFFPYDAGLQAYYQAHYLPQFNTGNVHSISSNPQLSSMKLLASFGNPANKKEPIKYSIIPFQQLSSSTAYSIIIPALTNPSLDCQLTLRISIMMQDNTGDFIKIISRQTLFNNQRTQQQPANTFKMTQFASNSQVQSINMSWSTQITQYGSQLTSNQFILLAYNNNFQGIVKSSFQQFSVSGFNIYFFSNINLYVINPQNTQTGTITISFSPLSTSDDSASYGWQYGKIFNGLNTQYTSPGTQDTLSIITSLVGSIYRNRGFTNVNSQYEIVLNLNAPKIPKGGYLEIDLPSSYLQAAPSPVGDLCFPGKNVANDPSSPLVCYKTNDYTYIVQGTVAFTQNTAIQINMFLVGKQANPTVMLPTVKAFGPNGLVAQSFNIASIPIDGLPQCVNQAVVIMKYLQNIYCNQYGPFQFSFILRQNDIIQAQGQYIQLTMENSWNIAPTPAVQSAYYKQTSQLTWYNSIFNDVSTSPLVVNLPPALSSQFNKQTSYTFNIDTTQAAVPGQNGVQRPQCGFYQFSLSAFIGGNAISNIVEKDISYFLLEPQPDTTFIVKPLLLSANSKTAYKMSFKTNVNIQVGDEIWFSFTTSNFINNIFPETLGFNLNQDGFGQIDCAENPGQNLISATQIKCYVHKGSATVVPPVMASVQIPVQQAINTGTTIIIWLSNIQNPAIVGIVSSVQAAVKRKCRNDNWMCNIYVSYNYFQTITGNPNYLKSNQISTATSTANQQTVYQTNTQHTFSLLFLQDVKTSDFIVIHYQGQNYQTARMSPTCTAYSFCLVFPIDQIVLIQLSTQIAANTQFSLILSGMTNGYFLLDNTQNFYIEVLDGSQYILNVIYQVPAILYSYATQSMTMSITPTQTYNVNMPAPTTQNFFLRDYINTVVIQIQGVWLTKDITNFYFTIPTQIQYIQKNYCNATLTVPSTNRQPYPLRFDCNLISNSMIELDMTNEMIPFQQTYQSYTIQIYLQFYIDKSAPLGITGNFQFIGGIDRYPQNYNQYRAVSLAQQTIQILPYVLPDLSYLTFNTKSFFDREARICQTQIEFYMILFPNTSIQNYKIDQLVFRLPNEFGYPAVKGFDNCSIKGKFNDNVLQCILQRKFAQTKVYMQPDITYNQDPKIIEINDSQGNLFTAPCIPGAQYNITVELYSQGILVEKQTIITSPVLGVPLAPSQMNVIPYFDAQKPGLFEFKFQLGQYSIPQGYDAPLAQQFSTIVLTFDSNIGKGYLNDLGTGLKTGDELGCVIKQQIPVQPAGFQLAQNQNRLKCVLQQGWDSINLPRINITGYQEMPAGTVVQFLITNIQALPVTITSTISMGVAVTYKNTNVTAFFYQSTAIIPTAATADARTISNTGQITQQSNYPSSQFVLGYSDYLFQFTSGKAITTNDYIGFQFDQNMFDRQSDYTQVGCIQGTNTPCSEIHVFGITNQIYIKPGTNIAATSQQTITLKKLNNAAYSFSGVLNVLGFSQVSQKVDIVYPLTTNLKVVPCNQFKQVIISIDKIVGGENDATVTLNITPGHYIPPFGAISVLFSSLYPFDLMQMKSYCNVTSQTQQNYYGLSRLNCLVSSYNRVDIYLNNATYSQNDQITLQIHGLNTPNFQIPQTIPITISSYFDFNIYAGRKICTTNTYIQQMSYIAPSVCNMFVIQGSSNVNSLSLYTFKFICQYQYIKDRSTIFIAIDQRFRLTNTIGTVLNCYSADMVTLASSQCQLLLNSNYKYGLQANLRSIESQTFFEISVYLMNPDYPGKDYYFSAEISKYKSLYAIANDQNNQLQYITLIRPQIKNDANSQIQILNVPRNAGEKSTYAIGIPPQRIYSSTNAIDTVVLEFPSNFASNLGHSLVCGVYFSLSKPTQDNFSYKKLLSTISQKEQDTNYYQLTCTIISPQKISFQIPQSLAFNTLSQNNWVNWLIKNMVNPSQYEKLEGFKFTYFSQGAISWYFQGNILYQISSLPKSILTSGIQVSDNNINTQAQYQFGIQSYSDILYYNKMAISIRLPVQIFRSVVEIQTKPFCSIFNITSQTPVVSSFCDFYQFELLIENVLLEQFNLTQILINVTNILNPTTTFSCNMKDQYLSANVSFFEIKLIDLSIGDVLFTNNINTDQANCVDYVDNLFNTALVGASILSPGLSYNFTINIEEPADGLTIIPSSDISGVKFNPTQIQFLNFVGTSSSFNVIVSADLMPSKPFYIRFKQTEQNGKFFLPLVPHQVQIVGGQQATVTVQDVDVETTGYPIVVPVIVSQPPANILNLVVQVSSQCQNLITINPSMILIDSSTFQTNFTITVNVNQVPSYNCILYFSLSSYDTIVHKLIPVVKYISFSLSNSYISPKPLRVILDKYQRPPSSQAGMPCLNMNTNYNAYLVIPSVFSLRLISTDANHAQFQALTSSLGYFVAVFALQGSPAPTANQMKNPYTYPYSVAAPQIIQVKQIISDKVDYTANFSVYGLESQTDFAVYGMIFNPDGYSETANLLFKTLILNYGTIIHIPLSDLLKPEEVIDKLSKTIRVPTSRFINITSYEYNLQQKKSYQQNSNVAPNYFYEIILAPNQYNDNPSPKQLVDKFIANQLGRFQQLLPQLNIQGKLTSQLSIQVPPKIQVEPQVTYLSYYQVKISMKLVAQGYVYAQIQPYSNSTQLLSRQVYYCLDQQNFNQLSELCFSGLTDAQGNIVISFNNILDSSYYQIYITVSTNMIYKPNIFYEDNEVRYLKIFTPINQNLFLDEGDLTSLKSVNPDLADAIERFLEIPFFHHISQEDTERVMGKSK